MTTPGSVANAVHRPVRAAYSVRQEGADIVVACQYWEVRHAARHGGNIASVVFRYGSGTSIFAAPCSTHVRRGLTFSSRTYDNALDDQPAIAVVESGGEVKVECRSRLRHTDGEILPATCVHTFTYHAWGVIRQRVAIEFTEPVKDAWNITIARPVVAAHLNEFTWRPAWQSAAEWGATSGTVPWVKLNGGGSFRDSCAAETGEVPLHLMFLQRGVEGFDWFCGENLEQWHERFTTIPHIGKFRVSHQRALGGYEVTLCPLDYWGETVELAGRYEFDFFMGLPFVQEHVRPLLRTVGASNATAANGSLTFLSPERIAELGQHHGQLVRHHDDSPRPDGIYWRDGSYPPYPPEQMRQLDTCIAELRRHGIATTPYFSLHEHSPASPDFAAFSTAYRRSIHSDGRLILNRGPGGVWGAHMCLKSPWREVLKQSISRVLSQHAFAGLYFDWVQPLACRNPAHGGYVHWDIEGFMDMLAWSREQVGEDGILYLHASLSPFVMAENLATCVLVYESPGPDVPARDMFPPIAEFMKTCSHLVLGTEAQHHDPRRFLLHCLLNHVTVDRPSAEFLAAYDVLAQLDLSHYTAFANQAVSPVATAADEVLSAVYWNGQEALVLLANLRDEAVDVAWRLDARRIGWGSDGIQAEEAVSRLAPLAFRYLRVRRAV